MAGSRGTATTARIPKIRWARSIDGVGIAYQDFGRGALTLVFVNGLYSHLEVYWGWCPAGGSRSRGHEPRG